MDEEPRALRPASIRGAQAGPMRPQMRRRSLKQKVKGRVVAAEGVRRSGDAPLGIRETSWELASAKWCPFDQGATPSSGFGERLQWKSNNALHRTAIELGASVIGYRDDRR